jgi:hypothetical protein
MARRIGGPGTQQQAADGRRPPPELPIRAVIAAAARAGWRHRWRTLAVAIAVSTVTAVLEITGHEFVDRTNVPLLLFTELSAAGVSILGTVLLSGFLCRLVGESGHGKEHASVWRVARSLPWRRLVAADLLVALSVVIGTLLLVIPGLVALTFFSIVGPVIELEGRGVFAGLRRSAHLVRRHFWTAALLATVPLILAGEIESIAPEPVGAGEILEVLAVRGVLEALVEAAIGLTLVELSYRLIALDGQPKQARRPGRTGR